MDGISKDFPGVQALRSCRFELRRGEIHALVGENGAGKTTLMKILAGVYRMDAGRIRLKGADVDIPTPRAAQQLGISIIHQELSLMPHLTAAQNIFIGREPRGRIPFVIDARRLNEQARTLFRSLNLNIDPQTKVGKLSVAQQQMVEIAKALSYDAQVLIIDEPTAILTDNEIEELFLIIRSAMGNGGVRSLAWPDTCAPVGPRSRARCSARTVQSQGRSSFTERSRGSTARRTPCIWASATSRRTASATASRSGWTSKRTSSSRPCAGSPTRSVWSTSAERARPRSSGSIAWTS